MPLSPHLPIYRVQITSLLSIMHRLSELALYGAALLITFMLLGCTFWPSGIDNIVHLFPFPLGVALGVAILGSWVFHGLSSVRYLAWDLGFGFALHQVAITGWTVLILTPFFTLALLWSAL